jgi:hypothetical protein
MSCSKKTIDGILRVDATDVDFNGDVEVDNLIVNNNATVGNDLTVTNNTQINGILKVDEINSTTGSGSIYIEGTDFRAQGVSVVQRIGDVDAVPSSNNVQSIIESNRTVAELTSGNWDETLTSATKKITMQGKGKHIFEEQLSGSLCEKYSTLARDPASLAYCGMYWNVDSTVGNLPFTDPEDVLSSTTTAASRFSLFMIEDGTVSPPNRITGTQYIHHNCAVVYLNTTSAAMTLSPRLIYGGIYRNAYNTGGLTLTFPSAANVIGAGSLVKKDAVTVDTEILNTVMETTIINDSTQIITMAAGGSQTVVGTALGNLAAGYGRTLYHYFTPTNYVTIRTGPDYLL